MFLCWWSFIHLDGVYERPYRRQDGVCGIPAKIYFLARRFDENLLFSHHWRRHGQTGGRTKRGVDRALTVHAPLSGKIIRLCRPPSWGGCSTCSIRQASSIAVFSSTPRLVNKSQKILLRVHSSDSFSLTSFVIPVCIVFCFPKLYRCTVCASDKR